VRIGFFPCEPGWSSSVAGVFAHSSEVRGEPVHSSSEKYKFLFDLGCGRPTMI
jgi:hypothetical protein